MRDGPQLGRLPWGGCWSFPLVGDGIKLGTKILIRRGDEFAVVGKDELADASEILFSIRPV